MTHPDLLPEVVVADSDDLKDVVPARTANVGEELLHLLHVELDAL